MPTHKIHRWLEYAIKSVSNSVGVNVELVIVLDGLPENSLENVTLPSNTKILSFEQNKGLSSALEAGIQAASSELIARLDSDDVMTQDRLSKQANFLRTHDDVVLVGCQMNEIDENGRIIFWPRLASGLDIREELLRNCIIPASGAMFRKSAYERAGRVDTKLFVMEDYDLWLRLSRLGVVSNLPEQLISYRVHSQQLSHQTRPWGYHTYKVLKDKVLLSLHLKIGFTKFIQAVPLWWIERWYAFLRSKSLRLDSIEFKQ